MKKILLSILLLTSTSINADDITLLCNDTYNDKIEHEIAFNIDRGRSYVTAPIYGDGVNPTGSYTSKYSLDDFPKELILKQEDDEVIQWRIEIDRSTLDYRKYLITCISADGCDKPMLESFGSCRIIENISTNKI
jgi:hypothetical protein|tara:strand:- start:534 stop:938 length:405 start_codon:yes stop_codon:yes gene_type:complete